MTPLIFGVVVITLVVWMTQCLQRIDIIVEHGASVAVFAWLSLLIVPSLLSVIIPFAIFGAAVYALQRLHSDSEIAVIFAAGVSRWRIAAPLLFITFFGAAATLWVNLDLMPRSYRTLKQSVADIRADFAGSILRSGEFTTVINGLTIYVEESRPGGQFVGLLVNDYRDGKHPETYMAQRGLLRETENGPVLYLVNGNIQQVARYTNDVDFVKFEETAINLSSFQQGSDELQLELTERYLSELFNPDLSNEWDKKNANKLIAEGHNRLASPLYAFAYVFIAVFALIGGAYNRRGYAIRIALACAGAGALRILGFIMQGMSSSPGLFWMQYAIPIAAIVILAVLISDKPRRAIRAQKQMVGPA